MSDSPPYFDEGYESPGFEVGDENPGWVRDCIAHDPAAPISLEWSKELVDSLIKARLENYKEVKPVSTPPRNVKDKENNMDTTNTPQKTPETHRKHKITPPNSQSRAAKKQVHPCQPPDLSVVDEGHMQAGYIQHMQTNLILSDDPLQREMARTVIVQREEARRNALLPRPAAIAPTIYDVDPESPWDEFADEEEEHFLQGHTFQEEDESVDEEMYAEALDADEPPEAMMFPSGAPVGNTHPNTSLPVPEIVSEPFEQSNFFTPLKTAGDYVGEFNKDDMIYHNKVCMELAIHLYKSGLATKNATLEEILDKYVKDGFWEWGYTRDQTTGEIIRDHLVHTKKKEICLRIDNNNIIFFTHKLFPGQRFYVSCKKVELRAKEIFNLGNSEEASILSKKTIENGIESVHPEYAFVSSAFLIMAIEKHSPPRKTPKPSNPEYLKKKKDKESGGFIFTIFHTPEQFYKFTTTFQGQERVIQEVIIQEHRPIFDIERSLKGMPPQEAENMLRRLRDGTAEKYFVPLLADYIFKYFNVRVTKEEILIIDSSNVNEKFSMHVTVSTKAGHFLKSREDGVVFLFGFAQYLEDFLGDPKSEIYNYFFYSEANASVKSIVDFSVYTMGQRNMRMLGAVKGSHEFTNVKELSQMRMFRPYGEGNNNVYFYRYLCTVNYGTFREPFTMTEEMAQNVYWYGHDHSKAWNTSHWQFLLPRCFSRSFPISSFKRGGMKQATKESIAAYASKLPVMRDLEKNPSGDTPGTRSEGGKIEYETSPYPRWNQEANTNYIKLFCEWRDNNDPRLQKYLDIHQILIVRFARVIHPRLTMKPLSNKFNSIMIGDKQTAVFELRIFPTAYFATHETQKDKCCLFGCSGGSHDVSITIYLDFSISYYCFACSQRKTFENFRIGGNYLVPVARQREMPDYMKDGLIDYFALRYMDDIENGNQIYTFNRAQPGYMQKVSLPEDYTEHATIVLRGPMGSGKTHTMKAILDEALVKKQEYFDDNSLDITVLSIGFRIVLSQAAAKNLSLTFYKDVADTEKMYDFKRLAIQLESLSKLLKIVTENGVKREKLDTDFDIVILDESESLLSQFDSTTMVNDIRIFNIFQHIVKNAKYLIVADADIGPRTYDLLKLRTVSQNSLLRIPNLSYHYNSDGSIKTKFIDYHSLHAFYSQMVKTLLQVKKHGKFNSIFIVSNTREKLNGIVAMLRDDFWEKLLDLHTQFGVSREYFEKICTLFHDQEILERGIESLEETINKQHVDPSEYLNDTDPVIVTSGPEGGNFFKRYQTIEEKKLVEKQMKLEDVKSQYNDLLQRKGLSDAENKGRLPDGWLTRPGTKKFGDLPLKNLQFYNFQSILKDIEVIDVHTEDKEKERLTNANREWGLYRILGISPTIGAGIDYSGDGFESTFVYACNHSTSARGLNQMRGRVRYPQSMQTHMFFEPYILCSDPKDKAHNLLDTDLESNKKKVEQEYRQLQNAGSIDQNGVFQSALTPEFVNLRADIRTEIDRSHNDMRTSMIDLLRSPTLQYRFDLSPFAFKDRNLMRRLTEYVVKYDKKQNYLLARAYVDPVDKNDYSESPIDATSTNESFSQIDPVKDMQRITSENTMSTFAPSQSHMSLVSALKSASSKHKKPPKMGESMVKQLFEITIFFGFARERVGEERLSNELKNLKELPPKVRNFIITTCCSLRELEILQTNCPRAPLAPIRIHESHTALDGTTKHYEIRNQISSTANEPLYYQTRDYVLRVAWILGFHLTPYDYSKREFEIEEEFPRYIGDIPNVLPFFLQRAHSVTCIRRLEIEGVNEWLHSNYAFICEKFGGTDVLKVVPAANIADHKWTYVQVYNLFKNMCANLLGLVLIKTVPSKFKDKKDKNGVKKKKPVKPKHAEDINSDDDDDNKDDDDDNKSQDSEVIVTDTSAKKNGLAAEVAKEPMQQIQKSNGSEYHEPDLSKEETFTCCLGCELNMEEKIPKTGKKTLKNGKCEVAMFTPESIADYTLYSFYHLFRPIEAEYEISLKPFRNKFIENCGKYTGVVKTLEYHDLRSTMADPVPVCIFNTAVIEAGVIQSSSEAKMSDLEKRMHRGGCMINSKSKDKQIDNENLKRQMYIEKYSTPPPERYDSLLKVIEYFANKEVHLKIEMELRQIEIDHARAINAREDARVKNFKKQFKATNEKILELTNTISEDPLNTEAAEEYKAKTEQLRELEELEKEYKSTKHLWQSDRKFLPIMN